MPWMDTWSASSLQTDWPNSASLAAYALLRTSVSAASPGMRLSLSISRAVNAWWPGAIAQWNGQALVFSLLDSRRLKNKLAQRFKKQI